VGDYLSRFASPQHTEAAYAMSANWDLRPLWEALPHIDTPTVLAAGRRDTWIPASDVRLAARRLPHGSYRDWAELGHLAHEEAPAVVADFIVDVAAAAGSA
jgi:magnesium chelatase accessory protein